MSTENSFSANYKVAVAIVVFLALLFVPSPLLPPHRFAEAIQSLVGISWKPAYLLAAIGLQVIFYVSIGIVSAFVVKRASTIRGRLLQIIALPVIIVLVALIIRTVKIGHLPVWINAAIPISACLAGVWLGLGLRYQRGKIIFFILLAVLGATFWGLTGGTTAQLSRATEIQVQKLVASDSTIPLGDARFGALLQVAFTPPSEKSEQTNAIEQNRAAILALGIVLGDERLAKLIGLKLDSKLMHQVTQLRKGTTLRERSDWPRHFCVSAALAVLENSLVSDAGGLMKEQLDVLTRGSGFSFCDFAADRAGARFATTATNSEEDAKTTQDLIREEFLVSNFFPPVADLPENLTKEQFRSEYGTVGSQRYREEITEIEKRLNTCAALSPRSFRENQK